LLLEKFALLKVIQLSYMRWHLCWWKSRM